MQYFEDGNCPGMVYIGGQEERDALYFQGGFAIDVHESRVEDGKVWCPVVDGTCAVVGRELVEPKPVPEHWIPEMRKAWGRE